MRVEYSIRCNALRSQFRRTTVPDIREKSVGRDQPLGGMKIDLINCQLEQEEEDEKGTEEDLK
jgi:hypothetical protein